MTTMNDSADFSNGVSGIGSGVWMPELATWLALLTSSVLE